MAELGSIQFEDSRQRTSVRDQHDDRDVLKGIQDVGEAAIEARQEDILGDFRNDLDDTTAEAVAAQEDGLESAPLKTEGLTEAEALVARIASLKSIAGSSSGNTQRRVEMELRKQTERLRNKYPGLRQSVDAEFGAFKSTDADFAALALGDAADLNFNAQSAQEIALIKKEAYGDADGQLGLDPVKHRFGTIEFADEYLYRSGLQQSTEKNTLYLSALSSQKARAAVDLPAQWNKQVAGPVAAVNLVIDNIQKDARLIAEAIRHPTAQGAAGAIGNWNLFGKDQALDRLEVVLFAVEESFQAIPIEFAETNEYKAIKQNKDALVEQFRVLGKAVASGDPTLMDVYSTMDRMRTFRWEGDNPDMVRINTMVNASQKTLELAMQNEFGADTAILGNEMAKYINRALPNVLATTFGMSGQANPSVVPGLAPDELMDNSREFMANNPDRYGSLQSGEGLRTGAISHTKDMLGPAMSMAIGDGDVNPEVASAKLSGLAAFANDSISNGALESDGWNTLVTAYSNPAIMDMNKFSLESSQPRAGEAFGEQAEAVWFKGEQRRLDNYITTLGGNISGGLVLNNVLEVDISSIKDGTVRFTVDEEKLTKNFTFAGGHSRFGRVDTAPLLQGAISEAQRRANDLSAMVTTHLRAKTHIQALKQRSSTADYESQWVAGKFKAFFDPAVEEES